MTLTETVRGLTSLSSTLLAVTTITIILRFVARYKQKARFLMDDWMVVSAWIFFIGLTTISFYGMSHKFMGHAQPHDINLANELHTEVAKTYLSLDIISTITLGLSKLSALFFFRRIFCTPIRSLSGRRDVFSVISAIAIAVIILWTIGFFIFTFLTCGPHVNFIWAPSTMQCRLTTVYFNGTTISNFLFDLFVFSLPIYKIWSLNMTTNRKVGVSGVFLLALVGLASSTARMVISIGLSTKSAATNNEDYWQINTTCAYLIILEAGMTIIAVNLPSLWYYTLIITRERLSRLISFGSGRGSQAFKRSNPSDYQTTGNQSTGEWALENSSTANLNLDKSVQGSVETYAMTDMDKRSMAEATMGIRVDHSFLRIEEEV